MVALARAMKFWASSGLWRWVACLCRVLVLVWLSLFWIQAQAEVQSLKTADAEFFPEGLTPSREGCLSLSHRWDKSFAGRGGRAVYRIQFDHDLRNEDQPIAFLFTRIGNQARVSVNGEVVGHMGTLGDQRFDAAKTARLLVVPSKLLNADGRNVLVVEVTAQAMRWGGLSEIKYGRVGEIEPLYAAETRFRHTSHLLFAAALLLAGAMTTGLWWLQRDPVYGCFALVALFGIWRNLDRVWPDVPVPWPLWGGVVSETYLLQLLLICRFVLLALDQARPRWIALLNGVGVVGTLLVTYSFVAAQPVAWTLALYLLAPAGLMTFGVTCRVALQTRRRLAWVLVVVGALALLAGWWDLRVREGAIRGQFSLMPYILFVFVVVLGMIVAHRYAYAVRGFEALQNDLSNQVTRKEGELRRLFESVEEEQRARAVAEERQRMMRDIHDGVGAQLVGLLNLVQQRDVPSSQLTEQVNLALDEMRMAIDSLQPVDGDLATVLGTLRYRLQPRLAAAGIEVEWDMPVLPSFDSLSPQVVLHIQRILLEAFTNVLKHANARRIIVSAQWQEEAAQVLLRVRDDGVGIAPSALLQQTGGRGLENMRQRAQHIGATVEIRPLQPVGTEIMLVCPIRMGPQPA